MISGRSRLLAVVLLLVAGRALAAHDEPKRAKALKAPLVTVYQPCTAPNTQTTGFPSLPACSPPVRMDPVCGFTDPATQQSGYGKASAKARPNGDFRVDITAKGLNPGCEGQTLCGTIRVRATTNRCAGASCTVADLDFMSNSATACCTVMGGYCAVSTTIDSEVLGTLVVNDRTGLEVYGFGLKRITGPNLPATYTFVSGGLTP